MKEQSVLVLNCGSTSIKFALYAGSNAATPELLVRGSLDTSLTPFAFNASDPAGDTLVKLNREIQKLDHDSTQFSLQLIETLRNHYPHHVLRAVAHRVVHGGVKRCNAEIVNDVLISDLVRLAPLAPLHQAANLAPIIAIKQAYPELTQVACFDTSFHCHQPEPMQLTALPRRYFEQGFRRMGFHGLSYKFVVSRIAELTGCVPKRLIAAHLGGGATVCGMLDGVSVSCSMGATALDGLPMATRSGSIDPGLLLYLLESEPMSIVEMRTMLYEQSGLLGMSGISGDMRVLVGNSSPAARAAIDVFVQRVAREIAATAADLGGIDMLVFTGGIGEHQAPIRHAICERLAWMGVRVTQLSGANITRSEDRRIHENDSGVNVWVIHTDEEWVMAGAACALIMDDNSK